MNIAVMILSISNILLWLFVWRLIKEATALAIILQELGLLGKFEQILERKIQNERGSL